MLIVVIVEYFECI